MHAVIVLFYTKTTNKSVPKSTMAELFKCGMRQGIIEILRLPGPTMLQRVINQRYDIDECGFDKAKQSSNI